MIRYFILHPFPAPVNDASLKGPQKNEEENMNKSNDEASISEDNSIEKGNTKPTHNPKKENYGHGPDHAPPDSGPRPTSGAISPPIILNTRSASTPTSSVMDILSVHMAKTRSLPLASMSGSVGGWCPRQPR